MKIKHSVAIDKMENTANINEVEILKRGIKLKIKGKHRFIRNGIIMRLFKETDEFGEVSEVVKKYLYRKYRTV